LISVAAIVILWATTFVPVPICPYWVTETPVDCSNPIPALWVSIVIAVIAAAALVGMVLLGWFRSRRSFTIIVSVIVVILVLGVAWVFAEWISDRILGNF
jgi:hypothetical protein